MDRISVDVQLSPEDWDAFRRHLQRQILKRPKSSWRNLVTGLYALIPLIILALALTYLVNATPGWVFLTGLLLFVGFVTLSVRGTRRQMLPSADSIVMLPVRFEFDATGFHTVRELSSGFVDWRSVRAIDETPEQLFLSLDRISGYIIPKRQITAIPADALAAQLRQWRAERQGYAGGSLQEAAVPEPTIVPVSAVVPGDAAAVTSPFWSSLRQNLLAGLRALFLRAGRSDSFVVSFDQLAALLLLTLAIAVARERITADADAEFSTYAACTWLALLTLGLWICALLARAMSPQADTRRLLVAGLAMAPWILVIAAILGLVLPADGVIFAYALAAIGLWASVRAVKTAYGTIRPRAPLLLLAVLLVFDLSYRSLYLDTHLWSAPAEQEDDSNSAAWQETEGAFLEQKDRIYESIAMLEPQRPGATDFYFMGFAGDGSQRVFRREALLGQHVFAQRLATGPRSLLLINDYRDLESFPLATLAGLRYALSEVGRVMDANDDVLVLFLTSHGSPEQGLSVRNGFDTDLPPNELRSALDDAGIRWRIVIVSACYSGVFVEPLKTDTTMILTAADSQHTSFGCADDRDLTYFGEAFLHDALPKASSLQAAYETARQQIAGREAAEQLTPSNPQMWVGASMARKLASLGPLPLGSAPSP